MNTNKTQTEQLTQDAVMQSVLKASDLRVGNLVHIPQLKDNFEIGAIYENGRFLTKNNKHSFSSIECANPIPLTEEWLNKFDFYKWDNEYSLSDGFFYISFKFFKNGNIKLWINGESKKYAKGEIMIINYVHQLQNLYFALTQRELTVA